MSSFKIHTYNQEKIQRGFYRLVRLKESNPNLLIRSQTLYPVELQALFYNLMHMSNKTIIFFASKEDNKQRIDICLSKKFKNQSRSNLKKDIIEKRVKLMEL